MEIVSRDEPLLAELASLCTSDDFIDVEWISEEMKSSFWSPKTTFNSSFPKALIELQESVARRQGGAVQLPIRFGWAEMRNDNPHFFVVCGYEEYEQASSVRCKKNHCFILDFVEEGKENTRINSTDLNKVFETHEVHSLQEIWMSSWCPGKRLSALKKIRWYESLSNDQRLFTFMGGSIGVILAEHGWVQIGMNVRESEWMSFPKTHQTLRPEDVMSGFLELEKCPEDKLVLEKLLFAISNRSLWNSVSEIDSLWNGERSRDSETRQAALSELDGDGNGVLDVAESGLFQDLLKSHQSEILAFDKAEGNQFLRDYVKLSKYLQQKASALQNLYVLCLSDDSELTLTDREERFSNFKDAVSAYELQLYSAMTMVASLVKDDRITFYEIHDAFDELGLFNSQWQNDVLERLLNINMSLSDVLSSINSLEEEVSWQLSNLSWVVENSTDSLSECLRSIDSSIQTTNLLQTVQVYQNYKRNKRLSK